MKITPLRAALGAALAAALAAGCATTSGERELSNARAAYERARSDPAVTSHAQLELEQARTTLSDAERLAASGANGEKVEHLAYLAEQRANVAAETGRLRSAEAAVAAAGAERNAVLLQQRERELSAEREQKQQAQRAQDTAQQQAQQARDEAQRQAQQTEQAQSLAMQHEREAREARERASALSGEILDMQTKMKELQTRRTDRGFVLTLGGDFLFETGQSTLKPGARRSLDNVASLLRQHSDQNVVVEGFTDSRGSEDFNQRLSEKRAQAVKDALVASGIDSARIVTRGQGKAYPVASNDNETGRQLNRRVEILVTPQQAEAQGTPPAQGVPRG